MNIKDELYDLLDNAYAPYSNFRVSAIVVMNDGEKFYGVNVENASYGATICAERNAINSAIAKGYSKGDFKKIYIMTDGDKISSCCFVCRQVISEFFEEDCEVIFTNKLGNAKKYTVRDICPVPFNSEDLQ